MKIQIKDKTFLEAEQDSHWLSLGHARQMDGICIVGIATCYGFVIYSKEKLAACHISSINSHEYIQEMVDYVKNKKDLNVAVMMFRSEYGYNLVLDDNEEEDEAQESAKEFFAKIDKEYSEYFQKHFQITPKIFNIPHPFFTISLNGKLEFYKEHQPGTIDYHDKSSEFYVTPEASDFEKKTSAPPSPVTTGVFSKQAQKRLRDEPSTKDSVLTDDQSPRNANTSFG